ncbi:DNA primase small subunit [Halogeometricum pallidum JCM 14848]|uniref:DNA primase small subunit PriS n=1 Tax=Halogeometricum pallidum JCM 14848 TaxID=1227487 RepID=M0DH39_HALPD|nr:DNA primase small subunit PriS [Halogeometricum pallidum]ELZ34826.1 DNA primase small subunit [Halogeometricum pallidum JCM 14848]
MEARTREYLEGRFGDYYRRADVSLPPAAERREWGYIPWSAGGTTMVRHQSVLDLGDVSDFLARTAPRHVYFSSARFDDPGAGTMEEKDWRSADLVFDLDADHLPGVDPETTSYADMLAACKEDLLKLLEFLDEDFDFRETQVVFSGGRGYHVHVRDESVRGLDSEARREIVDYVRAIDLDVEGLVGTESNRGTTRRVLRRRGGWGARVHERLLTLASDLREMDEASALERLQELQGIGEGRAKTILGQVHSNFDAIREGNVEAGGPGTRILVDALAREAVEAETAPIDEPVTTDTKRLIRLPGSLHGGSSLRVKPLDRDDIADFDPLEDAVADRFRGNETEIRVTDPGPVEFDGDSFTLSEGDQSVEECLGVFLMARGRAEKVK